MAAGGSLPGAERAGPAIGSRAPASWNLLTGVFGDPVMTEIFSETRTVATWLEVERALAVAEAEVGLISSADAAAVVSAAVLDAIDHDELWSQTRNVGYPILPLVRMISARLPAGPDGRAHYGATTQDI